MANQTNCGRSSSGNSPTLLRCIKVTVFLDLVRAFMAVIAAVVLRLLLLVAVGTSWVVEAVSGVGSETLEGNASIATAIL